ncbi:MAG: hypothetical protein HOG05_14785 [Bacteroidetes bacterium]|nr:hypothetical protein [Bacteroidota bacterium]MBT3802413.1 hypothetical protein [Bacteroidota bacterium]MBT4969026.1 hypothetical protein [Bacteroidota bacterium]MBT5991608.1 hypothetical protein [Bacteroidota bacterium]MBT6836529.1 hypothetical protein [Bacteroidota bacterium]
MLKFFKQRNPLLYPFLFVFTFALNAVLYFKPSAFSSFDHSLIATLFNFDITIFSNQGLITVSIVFTFLQALIISQIFNKYRLTTESSLLPSFIFVTLEALFPEHILLNSAFISLFLILLLINLLLTLFDKSDAVQPIFFIAFFAGIGGMIYSPLYLFIILIILAVPTLKTPLTSEFAIIPFGFLIPIYLLGMVYYMQGDLTHFLTLFSNSFAQFSFSFKGSILPNAIPIGFLFLVLSIGFFKDTFVYKSKVVRSLRYHRIFIYFFVITLILFVFTSAEKGNLSYYFMVPITFFLSTMFSHENNKLNEFIFAGLLLVIAFMQANMLLNLL